MLAANFNGLNSANLPVWNRTYAGNAPASVTQTGNRYLFATAPTLAVTSTSATKTYGDDLTGTLSSMYSVSLAGVNANTYGNVLLADSAATLATLVGGAAAVSSNGAASTAAVAGSPYAVNVSVGTLSGLTGYGFTYCSPGTITVNPAALTVSANNLSKVYGDADPALTYAVTGLKNGEVAASVFSNALVRAAGETVPGGPYAITRGTLAANGNYTVNTFTPAALTITPAALRVIADDKARLAGDPNPPFTSRITGFRFADTIASLSGNLSLDSNAGVATPSGNYAIVPSGVSSPNYAVTFVNGTLRVGLSTPPEPLRDSLRMISPGQGEGVSSVIVRSAVDINQLPATASGPDDEGGIQQVIGDDENDSRRDCFASSHMGAMSCRR